METPSLDSIGTLITAYALPLAWKIAGALLLWVLGSVLIRGALRALHATLRARDLDATISSYLRSAVGVLLKVVLLLAILSVFGVETTSFAAMLAAAGVAVGMAWAGLLANFAAGVFMMVLRPFKTGDMVSAGGVLGVVKEVGLFATSIETPDGILTLTGNNKIFSDTIANYSHNPVRRVDRTAQLAHGVDVTDAKARMLAKVRTLPHVVAEPAATVELLDFNLAGTVLAVRAYCHNDHYWTVYFAMNDAIASACAEGGFPVPEQRQALRQVS